MGKGGEERIVDYYVFNMYIGGHYAGYNIGLTVAY